MQVFTYICVVNFLINFSQNEVLMKCHNELYYTFYIFYTMYTAGRTKCYTKTNKSYQSLIYFRNSIRC